MARTILYTLLKQAKPYPFLLSLIKYRKSKRQTGKNMIPGTKVMNPRELNIPPLAKVPIPSRMPSGLRPSAIILQMKTIILSTLFSCILNYLILVVLIMIIIRINCNKKFTSLSYRSPLMLILQNSAKCAII